MMHTTFFVMPHRANTRAIQSSLTGIPLAFCIMHMSLRDGVVVASYQLTSKSSHGPVWIGAHLLPQSDKDELLCVRSEALEGWIIHPLTPIPHKLARYSKLLTHLPWWFCLRGQHHRTAQPLNYAISSRCHASICQVVSAHLFVLSVKVTFSLPK